MLLFHSAINTCSPPNNKDFKTECFILLQRLIEIFYLPLLWGPGVYINVVMHLFLEREGHSKDISKWYRKEKRSSI